MSLAALEENETAYEKTKDPLYLRAIYQRLLWKYRLGEGGTPLYGRWQEYAKNRWGLSPGQAMKRIASLLDGGASKS